jgi:hypothetical protein
MFWKRRNDVTMQRAVHRLLDAASARGEVPEGPDPYFVSRVRARAAERGGSAAVHPFGLAAAQLLPVLGLVAMSLVAWSGVETVQAEQERAEVVRRVASTDAEALFVLALATSGAGQ